MTHYSEKYERIKFNNMEQLQEQVISLPKAEKRLVHVQGVESFNEYEEYHTLMESENFWTDQKHAIVNANTNSIAQIVSPGYKILQHTDFGMAVCDKLQFAGTGNSVRGYILLKDAGNECVIRLICEDVEIEEPNMGRNIKVGCEFSNSYDTSWAARGRAFFLRMSCTNQMIWKNVIPECIFSKSHIAGSDIALLEAVDHKIDDFLKTVLESGAKFEHAIEAATELDIEYANGVQLSYALQNLLKDQNRAMEIAERAHQRAVRREEKFHLTAWELYNEVSSHATHNPMSPNIFEKLLVRGERLLSEGLEIKEVPQQVLTPLYREVSED